MDKATERAVGFWSDGRDADGNYVMRPFWYWLFQFLGLVFGVEAIVGLFR